MKLLSKERLIGLLVIIFVATYAAFITGKLLEDKTLMLIDKDKVENVETCIDNNAACGLIQDTWEK